MKTLFIYGLHMRTLFYLWLTYENIVSFVVYIWKHCFICGLHTKTLTVLLVRIPPSALSDSFPFSLFPFPVPGLIWQVPKNFEHY